MYLVSLSQPHNAASVLELSRSLEFEHEVRREVTLQVMRWFGQVDDADELWCVIIRFVSASFFFALMLTLFMAGTVLAE